jgi:hypothetical protein
MGIADLDFAGSARCAVEVPMTRAATTTDTVTVAASSNIYTALVVLATIAVAIGLVVLFLRAQTLGVELLKF